MKRVREHLVSDKRRLMIDNRSAIGTCVTRIREVPLCMNILSLVCKIYSYFVLLWTCILFFALLFYFTKTKCSIQK